MIKSPILKKTKKIQPQRLFADYESTILRSPKEDLILISPTNTELTGPIFNKNIIGKFDNDLTRNFSKDGKKAIGQEIYLHGYVKDQFGIPQKNVLIEIWQANSGGKYRHYKDNNNVSLDTNFSGCGRFITSSDGF